MLKRTIWFTLGFGSGVAASAYVYNTVREARGKVAADGLAESVAGVARRVGSTVADAVAEGRSAMHDAEERIATDLERRGA